jgi:hypothetical protein
MTPEAAAALFALVKDFGLPLAILGAFSWLILSGRLVTGTQLELMRVLFERERTDRVAAQLLLAQFAGANAEVAEAVREVLTEVVSRDPYQDRLEGRRGR